MKPLCSITKIRKRRDVFQLIESNFKKQLLELFKQLSKETRSSNRFLYFAIVGSWQKSTESVILKIILRN